MLVVETIAKIRRAYFVRKKPIKEICRTLHGSYDAVRRYAISWCQERGAATASAFVPLIFAPGEAYQLIGARRSSC